MQNTRVPASFQCNIFSIITRYILWFPSNHNVRMTARGGSIVSPWCDVGIRFYMVLWSKPAFGIANTLVQEMNTNIWYDLKHISPHCPEHLRRETPDEQRWKDLPWHSRIEKGCNEIQKDNKALGPLGIKKYAFIAVACFSRFSPYLYLFTIVMTFHLSLLGTLGLGNSWVKLPPRNNNGKKSGILCCVHVVHVLFRNKSKKALANVTAMSNFWRVDCAGYIA